MAVIFMEGFGGAPTQTDINFLDDPILASNWTSQIDRTPNADIVLLENATEGIRKYATKLRSTAVMDIRAPLPALWSTAAGITLTVGFRVWIASTDVGAQFAVMELAAGKMYIAIDASGKLCYGYDTNHNTATASNYKTTGAIPTDQWVYVEIELELQTTTTGKCNIYIDGGLDSENLNVRTVNVATDDNALHVNIAPDTTSLTAKDGTRITDIYVTDGEVLGPVEIWYQPCDTAGSAANFTPSAGSNHQNVDDDGEDGDTTYNESTTPGQSDSFSHSDQAPAGVNPIAIQTYAVARCPDGLNAKVRLGIDSGGTKAFGGTEWITEDAAYIGLKGPIQETDPNTASAWTQSGANAAETVIEHVS